MKNAWKGFLGVGLSLSLLGCEESAKPAAEVTAQAAGAEAKAAPIEQGAKGPQKEAKPSAANAEAPAGNCPAGKWRYDYADAALEAMMSNLGDAKVTEESGSYVCTISEGKEGTISCATDGGKPVINGVSAKQGGMPLTVRMIMTGGTTSKFKITDKDKMTISETDMSGFDFKVEATVAGRPMNLPFQDLAMAFGAEGEEVHQSFDCTGDTLKLLMHLEDTKTDWLILKAVK